VSESETVITQRSGSTHQFRAGLLASLFLVGCGAEMELTQPPPPPPVAPSPPSQAQPIPPPPSAEQAPPSQWVYSYSQGQWVYASNRGWIWVPAGTATTDVDGVPYAYLYMPESGWTWYISPWGLGPYHYGGWVTHPWLPSGWRGAWVMHPRAGFRVGFLGGFRGSFRR
jgi:hypothetical protein